MSAQILISSQHSPSSALGKTLHENPVPHLRTVSFFNTFPQLPPCQQGGDHRCHAGGPAPRAPPLHRPRRQPPRNAQPPPRLPAPHEGFGIPIDLNKGAQLHRLLEGDLCVGRRGAGGVRGR